MVWQTVRYRLTGDASLLMHNGQTADPRNRFARQLKLISSKRTKTEADYEEMAHLEFLAGLYMAETGPVLPQDVLDATIIAGAKKSKEGQIAKSACFAVKPASLEYDGPRDAEGLWADERFQFSRPVKIGTSRVMRMRPIFEEWAATIELQVETSLVNIGRVDEWLNAAGTQVGICDWRPQHGRFSCTRLNDK